MLKPHSKILIQVCHPSQFLMFKNIAAKLERHGHSVIFAIKTKDILENLVQSSGFSFVNLQPVSKRSSVWQIFREARQRDKKLLAYAREQQIDFLCGAVFSVSEIGWKLHKPAISAGEDDLKIVWKAAVITGLWRIRHMLCPTTCDMGILNKRTVNYAGYQKLAYLHPNYFQPDQAIVKKYFNPEERPYFLLRFSRLGAYHDSHITGLNDRIADELILRLNKYGQVYISSERPLPDDWEPYRLAIHPEDMHHILYYASLFIGDSQSMAVESAMLGVPNIRFSDFSGRIGVLEELEHVYGLTCGIRPDSPEQLYSQAEDLAANPAIREEFQARRQKMLSEKIDVTAFFTWYIENFPESEAIMRKDPDYQYRFK